MGICRRRNRQALTLLKRSGLNSADGGRTRIGSAVLSAFYITHQNRVSFAILARVMLIS